MANEFNRLTDSELQVTAKQAHTVIAPDAVAYGVNASQMTALLNASTALESAIEGLTAARDAYLAAQEARDAARATTLDALSNVGSTIYNFASVTNEMIAAAGYAVRQPRTAIVPQYVTAVTVTPSPNGTAVVAWPRGGNRYGVAFQIEWRTEDTDWEFAAATTRTRWTLSGVTPGVTRYFRVIATKSDASAPPSPSAIAYGPGTPSLAMAA